MTPRPMKLPSKNRRLEASTVSIQENMDASACLTDQDVRAVFVEETEEIRLLRLVDRGQHVLWIEQGPYDAHQLDCAASFRVAVTSHLLNDDVHQ